MIWGRRDLGLFHGKPAKLVGEAREQLAEGALAAGYVDMIVAVDQCERAAIAEARRLGQLDASAYAGTKRAVRQATIDRIMPTLQTATV